MASIEQVRAHYDTDPGLFELFLDESYRAYSAGRWHPGDTLEQAQARNLASIIAALGIDQGRAVLDVGCGWGAFSRACAASNPGIRYTGLSPSPVQIDYINSLAPLEGSLHPLSWREYEAAPAGFDAVVALESMEHFASLESRRSGGAFDEYRGFFSFAAYCSKPGARLFVQSSLVRRLPRSRSELADIRFILNRVFRGSALADLDALKAASAGIYRIETMEWCAQDYIHTLAAWRARLNMRRAREQRPFKANVIDFFDDYLSACIRLFEAGVVDLMRMVLVKTDGRASAGIP